MYNVYSLSMVIGVIVKSRGLFQKQCSKLQHLKAKYDVEEEEARRREMDREKQLVAQPVKPSL